MNNIEFDKQLRDLVNSCSEQVDEVVWSGIESGLARRRRIRIISRVSYFAAAAVLVLGLILFVPSNNTEVHKLSAEVSSNTQTPELDEPSTISVIPSIPEQTAHLISPKNDVSVIKTIEKVEPIDDEVTEVIVAEDVVAEIFVSNEPAKKEVKDEKKYKTISEQIADSDYLAFADEDDKHDKRLLKVSVGASSNTVTGGPSSFADFSTPQYTSGTNAGYYYGIEPSTQPNHAMPVTAGIQFQLGIGKVFGLGLGINYSYLHSNYEAIVSKSFEASVKQDLHYIGVPVNLYANIITSDNWKCYVSAGGALEKGVRANISYNAIDENAVIQKDRKKESIRGYQWSANAGVGIEYLFNNDLGLYFDPSITYYFPADQPYSIRTEQPLQLKFELGLRFHIL